MKKMKLLVIAAALAITGIISACSKTSSSTDTTQIAAQASDSLAGDEEIHEAVGTISDIRDMQFVLTTDDGDAIFAFETAPEGLSTVKDGDMVVVAYTGEIDPVEAFTGKVLSVSLYIE